jgi:hypothetical protein
LNDEVFVVQEQVVLALVRLGDRELVPLMRSRLAQASPDRRVDTLRLIALIPERELVTDLGPFLADPSPEVRAFAAAAILSIRERVIGPAGE